MAFKPPRKPSSRVRLVVAGIAGVVAGLLAGVFGTAILAPLAGWDVAAAVYIGWFWLSEWKLDSAATAAHAAGEDPGRGVTDVLLLVASVASLGAVAAVIASGHSDSTRVLGGAVGLVSVALSWTLVHTVYSSRYARLFYADKRGVDFNEPGLPRYSDFAYLAFTIGMTYQVSDTDLTSRTVRSLALRHALLSYMLGAVVLAATINLVVGLAS